MNKKSIRVASICHNEDDHRAPKHRRVRLELIRDTDGRFRWYAEEGGERYDTDVSASTVEAACRAAKAAWGGMEWALRADWL